MSTESHKCNRGTDFTFSFTWTKIDGTAEDLSGWSLTLMDVSAAIAGLLTASIVDAEEGLVSVRIEWDDSLEANVSYVFRLKLTLGVNDVSTNLQEIVYQ